MMKKRILFLSLAVAALLFPTTLRAVPAYPAKRTVTLADGTEQTLTLTGDEYCHYWLAEDGKPMMERPDGTYRQLSYFELENIRAAGIEWRQGSNARRARRKAVGNFQPILGKKRGLVILVNFRDVKFSSEDPQAVYQDFFNKRGYTDYDMTGSVSDYFIAQSYGKFELDFDVVGPYTLAKAMGAYGAPNDYSKDSDPAAMVEEACKMADEEVNFANYDWDNDGIVDQVFVIYAGYGENYGAPANTIWPHESELYNELKLDYVRISTYACSCELSGTKGTELDGIGTACHEFSHCLGFPDFYDTSSSGRNFAMSYWDLMSAGSYNANSRTPAGYTAYEKWMAGWLEPVELNAETEVKGMKPLAEAPEAYILYNEAKRDEYYLLENRQPAGFDAGLPGHGMLVVHVDYDKNMWGANSVNTDASHQCMTIIAADANYLETDASLAGDPFPGTTGNTALTDDTRPAATLYNANVNGEKRMGKAIERITETDDGLISFVAMRPPLDIPQVTITNEAATSFTVNWNAIEKATLYELELTETPARQSAEDARILEEDFQGAYSKTAGLTDISSKLNTILSTNGFTGSGLYQTPDLLRLGTTTKNGELRTPTQKALSTGTLTIVMKVKPFAEGTKVTASVNIRTNSKPTETFSVEFDTERYVVLHPATVLDEIFRVDITANGRMYMQYLALYDGNFSEEELGLSAQVKSRRVIKQTLTTSQTSYTFSDLTPGSFYSLVVRAKDDDRASKWSQEVTFQAPVGIEAVSADGSGAKSDVWYDLLGRPVQAPQKRSIYIRNGRKVLF
ncbi:MAG: M6 family metalloprotease domain-containing protein [Bacteroidaceae bacterium]|nr:M6 family metalloprotease domain-containing protein [Bacteroidaceae bacterium]